jgi:hypothetical protein
MGALQKPADPEEGKQPAVYAYQQYTPLAGGLSPSIPKIRRAHAPPPKVTSFPRKRESVGLTMDPRLRGGDDAVVTARRAIGPP